MKFIRNLSFSLATIILLLHVLVPHEHHCEDRGTVLEHTRPATLIDQIALAFHLSQTDGQLEHFPGEISQLHVDQIQLLAVLTTVVFGIEPNSVQHNPAPIAATSDTFKSLNVDGFSHRGPPIA